VPARVSHRCFLKLYAFLACALVGGLAGRSGANQGGTTTSVLRCELTGTVDAGSAAYLSDCVEAAQRDGHRALLVRIDTPGGSLDATQRMVQSFLAAKVPILVWVGPAGARAGSAGTFLVLASHLAGMADATRIGAAHPVGLTGRDIEQADKHLAAKVENDAAAFAAAIARARGRNVEWAEKAVRESVSVPASEARQLKVVEMIAPSEEALLAASHGRTVIIDGSSVRLDTKSAQVIAMEPSFQQKLLHALANPTLAYLLLLVGGIGIAVELTSPGLILPGVVGVVSFVLAMVALAALPVRTGAVVLIVLGFALILAELFVASGLAGTAGVALLIVGGLFLIERVDQNWFSDRPLAIPARLVIPTAVLLGGASIFVLARVRHARGLPPQLGAIALVGQEGRALSTVNSAGGEVFIHGETWRATSERPVQPDSRVVVRSFDGLTLHVREAS
jgi:membrane-bound serine protease (ClpP class)